MTFLGYSVTESGQVLGRNGEPLRTRAHHRTGHLRVRLYHPEAPKHKCGRRYRDVYVHVAVCSAFHGPPPFDGALVMHADDDPTNNRPENLSWGTVSENAQQREDRKRDPDGFNWETGR